MYILIDPGCTIPYLCFGKQRDLRRLHTFAQYKKVRNRVVRSGRHQYFNSLASADNMKSVKLLNKNRESISTLQGDCIASSDKEMADMLNASCWNSSELPLTEEAYGNQSPYEDATITPEDVLHTTKATGPDGILLSCLQQRQAVLLYH